MPKRIFLAGASGVIGRRLSPLLVEAGHHVVGTTRSQAGAANLKAAGVTPAIVDVFDAQALAEAMIEAAPDVVIHQLTDLSLGFAADRIAETLRRNARIRTEGTRNLVRAANLAGAGRIVAQSIAWAYRPGPTPYAETAPLDVMAAGDRGVTVTGVAALETAVLNAPGIDGVVLRYGRIYGRGAGSVRPTGAASVHADAAAFAALLAVDRGAGVYNVAEPGGDVSIERATADLGWSEAFRLGDAQAGT